MADLPSLLKSTTGSSRILDEAISKELNVPLRGYSSSVDACLELIHELLPSSHWHVGRAEDGMSMYASLADGHKREESTNVTVPLALLSVVVSFMGRK